MASLRRRDDDAIPSTDRLLLRNFNPTGSRTETDPSSLLCDPRQVSQSTGSYVAALARASFCLLFAPSPARMKKRPPPSQLSPDVSSLHSESVPPPLAG